jgi:hypothetical protein
MGGFVPFVQVRAKSPDIRLARSAMTDQSGFYMVSGLAPGRYTVGLDVTGLSTQSQQILVDSDHQVFTLNFQLMPSLTETLAGRVITEVDPAVIERRKRQTDAEYLVERLWGWPLQRIWNPGNETSQFADRQRTITKLLHQLDKDGITALLLAVKDPDVQTRRNAALMLVDLSAGHSPEARPGLIMPETLPALRELLNDKDEQVRLLAAEAILQIQR